MKNQNLLEDFNEILGDSSLWSYYPDEEIYQSDGEFNYKAFIVKFIRFSEKENLLFDSKNKNKFKRISNCRSKHIVFTYFLGILFINENPRIKELITKNLSTVKPEEEEGDDKYFLFIWFLISIFHDFGYKYENSHKIPTYTDYKEFIIHEIKIDAEQLINQFKVETSHVIPNYYYNCFPEYLKYRFNSGKIDHGIIAGLILNDELCKIRSKSDSKGTSGLYWDKKLEKTYLAASSVILAHNIFYTRSGNENVDKYEGMKDLIYKEGEYKIKFEEYPLLFLFCLIDSIEPLKIMKNNKMLSSINFVFRNDNILEVSFNLSNSKTCKVGISKLKEKILGLNDWLTPVIQKNEIIEIQLFEKPPIPVNSMQ